MGVGVQNQPCSWVSVVKTSELPKLQSKDWSDIEFYVAFLGGHVSVADSGVKLRTYKISNEVYANFSEIVKTLCFL
jgi:hypothetical protein